MPATYCGKVDRNECVDTIFVEIFWNYPVDVGSPTGAEDHFEDHLTGVPKAAQLTDDSADFWRNLVHELHVFANGSPLAPYNLAQRGLPSRAEHKLAPPP